MGSESVCRVLTDATIENLCDLYEVSREKRAPNQVRRVAARSAIVDARVTGLPLPRRLIQQLGLKKVSDKLSPSGAGPRVVNVYDPVRLTIQERFCSVDVAEVSDEYSVLIGQSPLGMLDLVVDLRSRRLTGNPAHGGEHVLELY